MKLLHLSDFHLGVSFKSVRGRAVSEAINRRILDNINSAFKTALSKGVDLVVIPGDVFNSIDSSYRYLSKFTDALKVLYDHDVPTIVVAGNHEVPRRRGAHVPLSIVSDFGYRSFFYRDFLSEEPIVVETKAGKVGVIAIPHVHVLSEAKFRERISDLIMKLYGEIRRCDYKILVAHLDVEGAVYSGLDPFSNVYYETVKLPPATIHPEYFDYVALGHVHRPQSVKGYANMYYSGSLERISFGEAYEEKGFYIVDIEDGRSVVNFFKVNTVPMLVSEEFELDPKNPIRTIKNYLEGVKGNLEGALIRLRVRSDIVAWRETQKQLVELDELILNEYKALGYRVDFTKEIATPRTVDTFKGIEKWRLLDLMEKYVDSLHNISPEDRALMKKYLEELFSEARVL